MSIGENATIDIPIYLEADMELKDLIGKTIAEAEIMKMPAYDDEGRLRLKFTDGTQTVVVASYGGYTGNSEDEYPTYIELNDDCKGLVPVKT